MDRAGRIVMANANARLIFGYAKDEMPGMPVDRLVPDGLRGAHQAHRQAYMENPSPRQMAERKAMRMDLWGERKDGSIFPVEVSLSPIHTESGAFVFSVMRDISARAQQELEKRQQAELVRLLQDIAVASNESSSVDRALQYAVDRICQYLGWPVGHAYAAGGGDALAQTQIWNSGLEERYRKFVSATESEGFQPGQGMPGMALETGLPVWINALESSPHFLRKTEAKKCGLRTGLALPIMAGKKVTGVMEFFHEVELPSDDRLLAVLPHVGIQIGRVIERHNAEEALRRQATQLQVVLTNLPVMIWVIDRKGKIVLLEGKTLTGTGIRSEDFVGKEIGDRFAGRPEILQLIQRAMQGEEIHQEITAASGRVYDLFLTPFYEKGAVPSGMIGLSFDVTERKEMEAELGEMKQRLMESADAERARLAQQLHDGPLQDLYGAFYQIQEARLKLDGPDREMISHALQTIHAVNATLLVICGELHPSTLVHLGLQRAIRGHSERLQDRLDSTEIFLDLDDDTLPGSTLTQERRLNLYRVFQQLITNAAHHSGAKAIWVRLRLEAEQVVLEVEDNGQGFDAPDHWVYLVRERKFGLVTALERVQNMAGRLEIISHPGEGALVRVTVPRQAV